MEKENKVCTVKGLRPFQKDLLKRSLNQNFLSFLWFNICLHHPLPDRLGSPEAQPLKPLLQLRGHPVLCPPVGPVHVSWQIHLFRLWLLRAGSIPVPPGPGTQEVLNKVLCKNKDLGQWSAIISFTTFPFGHSVSRSYLFWEEWWGWLLRSQLSLPKLALTCSAWRPPE